MNWTLICTILGTLIALATLVLYARSSAQAAESAREQQIEAAVKPVRDDRDYWRNLATELQAELRRRN